MLDFFQGSVKSCTLSGLKQKFYYAQEKCRMVNQAQTTFFLVHICLGEQNLLTFLPREPVIKVPRIMGVRQLWVILFIQNLLFAITTLLHTTCN